MGSSRDDDLPERADKPPETVPNADFGRMAAACRHSKPARLIQVEGPGAPREVALGEDALVLGRDEDCDIQIPSGHVSRQHALVRPFMDNLEFRDLQSRNGSWLNNLRVHSATLREGDIVQIGDAVFVFRAGR